MTKRGRAAATFLGLLLGGGMLFAHDIADLEFIPNLIGSHSPPPTGAAGD